MQGDEWDAYVVLETFSTERNAGSPTGREPYGDGVPVVLRPCGVNVSVSEETPLERCG